MRSQNWILVTGGTGFVGVHVIAKLLQKGYKVKTTLRSLDRKTEIINALQSIGIAADGLVFIAADLAKDDNWNEAVKDCEYVLHVASPFPIQEPEDENELIIPARDGALRVLRAARDAGVRRVVLTSSFAAIGYGKQFPKDHVFTEEDWTDPAGPIRGYLRSKTIAEQAAWNFIRTEGGSMELSVINPVAIFGPVIGNISSASCDAVIRGILDGAVKTSPDFTMGVVDVRDVADIHLLAMENPAAKGQRFLATADGTVSFYDVAQIIKRERSQYAAGIADMNKTDQALYTELSNRKAKTLLGWQPRSKEEAILASVDSLKN